MSFLQIISFQVFSGNLHNKIVTYIYLYQEDESNMHENNVRLHRAHSRH